MRVLPATLLVGAAAAAAPPVQQVMSAGREHMESLTQQGSDAFSKASHLVEEQLKTLSGEAKQLWEEMTNYFPGTEAAPMLSLPKKATRRPSSHWDHIVSGADVQSVWVDGASGTKEREIDGKLEAYDLRVKKVDPASLGVDPDVKQYSGYLDDNENDKHLFYCEYDGSLIDVYIF